MAQYGTSGSGKPCAAFKHSQQKQTVGYLLTICVGFEMQNIGSEAIVNDA